eukprot:scaffold2548_cov66-Phaeocystis_antarctica.AAC.1
MESTRPKIEASGNTAVPSLDPGHCSAGAYFTEGAERASHQDGAVWATRRARQLAPVHPQLTRSSAHYW